MREQASKPSTAAWWAALILCFTGVLALLTAPAWFLPGRTLGHAESDIWKHLWGDAWMRASLPSQLPVPIETDLIWFPDGGLLYNLDPISGYASWLLSPLAGLVTAHNLIQALALLGGALAAYLLARRLTGDPAASAVAGAVYGFSAHIQGAVLASGIGETAHIAWIPLAILLLLELLEKGGWWRASLLGISLWLCALASWYYGLVAGLSCTAVLGAWLALRLSRRLRRDDPLPVLVPVAWVGAAVLLAGALTLPFAQAFLASLDPERALHGSQGASVPIEDLLPSSAWAVATLSDFLRPGHRIQGTVDRLFFCNHLGFTAGALALFALLSAQRRAGRIALGGLAAALVCLGPVIHLDRATPLMPNPLFEALLKVWPGFDLVRNLERAQVAVSLCVALLAALGLAALLDVFEQRGWRRRGLGLGLAALVALEANLVSGLGLPLPTASTQLDGVHQLLLDDPEPYAILELPLHDGPGGEPFWHQALHGHPLPMNLDNSPAPSLRGNRMMSALMPDVAFSRYYAALRLRGPTPEELEAARGELVQLGYRYAVLSEGPEPERRLDELRAVLEAACGAPVAVDSEQGVSLYALEPGRVPPGAAR
jgi:hypothetical protein